MLNVTIDKDAEDFLPLEEEVVRCYQDGHKKEDLELSNKDIENLGKSLQKILVIEPEKRVEAEKLLNDPWFSQ